MEINFPGYTGPRNGLSNPNFRAQKILRPLNKGLMALNNRIEVTGLENLPQSGKNVYCPTHPSTFDPSVVTTILEGDTRYMANQREFVSIFGPMITAMGAFPVDRANPNGETYQHSLDMVRQGKKFVIFPEGAISDNFAAINPLKTGPARIALEAGADTIVPISIHYAPDTQTRAGERAIGGLLATAVAVGGALASFGGPLTRTAVGVLTGAIAGAYGGKTLAGKLVPQKELWDPRNHFFAKLGGGAAGALAGGLAGGLYVWAAGDTLLPGLVGAGGTLGFSDSWSRRNVAHVDIGQPIAVAPYAALADEKQAFTSLTEDLHRALGTAKAAQSGVPYDDTAPKIKRGRNAP